MKLIKINNDFLEGFRSAPKTVFFILIVFSLLQIRNPFFATSILGWGKLMKIGYATGGLIQPTLLNSFFIILVCFLLFFLGRLKAKEIGFSPKNILPALVVLGFSWAAIQMMGILSCLFTGTPLQLHPDWHSPLRQIGQFLTFFFGVGVAEEFEFRAFLFPQFYSRLKSQRNLNKKKALFISIFISQLLFGLFHFYVNLDEKKFGGNIPLIFLWCLGLGLFGVLFVLLYLRSGNLYVAIVVHGLVDCPFTMMKTPIAPQAFGFLAAVLVLFFWPFRGARLKQIGNQL